MPQNGSNFEIWETLVIENKAPAQYFSVLSSFKSVQSLADLFHLHFSSLGHRKGESLLLSYSFQKIAGVWF